MTIKLKYICLLAIAGLLAACGSASDSSSGDIPPTVDDASPLIQSITPDLLSNTEVKISQKTLVFEFNEALDSSSISKLNNISFIDSSGKTLKSTWVYEDTNNKYRLTVTFDPSSLDASFTSLPSNEKFKFRFDNTITDLAGNGFIYEISFNTPLTYDVEIDASALPLNTSIEVEVSDKALSNPQANINQTVNVGNSTTISSRFVTDTSYLLSIKTQPNAETFCAFTRTTGVISDRNVLAQLVCSNVVPYNTLVESDGQTAIDWNAYYSQTDSEGNILSNKPNIHSGEQRKFKMDKPSNTVCDDLIIEDDIGAFEWNCKDDTDPTKFVIFSTKLKKGKYLSDLLNFSQSNPSWKTNAVSVKKQSGPELNAQKSSAIWWSNPVAVPTGIDLTEKKTIYIIPDTNSEFARAYTLSGIQTALVVKPGLTLYTSTGNTAGIIVNSSAVWLEGNFNVNNSALGIYVINSYQAQIHNLTVTNSSGDGIKIEQSELTFLSDVISTGNDGNGLSISGNWKIFDEVYGASISHVETSNNAGHGLYIAADSNSNKISYLNSNGNLQDGINIIQNSSIINSETSDNEGNGLSINGQNNIITLLTSSSNSLAGIKFTNDSTLDPVKNIVIHSTVTNNTGAGIHFDNDLTADIVDGNLLVNILDAFNGSLNCGSGTSACDNITSVNDVNLMTFSRPAAGETTKDWSLFDDDTVALNMNLSPASFINTHTFVGSNNPISFLENAYETFSNNSGNNNGLCETNETCGFAPNVGSYQGHATSQLIDSTGTEWETPNITLNKYSTNGYPAP